MLDFNDLNDRSLQAIALAKEESHRLGHNFIGSEQLLVGLLSANNGATQLLKAADVTLEAAQAEVEKFIGRGSGYVVTDPSMTPRAGRAIERAIAIAREQGFMLAEPEHLLLGILDCGEEVALRIIENLVTSLPQLREAIHAQLQTLPRQSTPQQIQESGVVTSLMPAIPSVDRTAPRMLHITTLPQETGRWVAQVNAGGSVFDGPSFRSIGYGDTDFKAIAEALESLARMYRDYRA